MSKPYKIPASSVPTRTIAHPLDSTATWTSASLGDATGLTQLGVYVNRVAPHTTSTVAHWHSEVDEWIYILDAGHPTPSPATNPTTDPDTASTSTPGAKLLILSEGATEPTEEPVHTGDFLGFAAGRRDAHALRAGEKELVYLVGGTRREHDVCFYPGQRKRLVADGSGRAGGSFFVEDEDVVAWQRPKAP